MVSLLPDSEIQENKTALGLDLSRYQPLEQSIKIIALLAVEAAGTEWCPPHPAPALPLTVSEEC